MVCTLDPEGSHVGTLSRIVSHIATLALCFFAMLPRPPTPEDANLFESQLLCLGFVVMVKLLALE